MKAKKIGDLLKTERKKIHISTKELGKELGISYKAVRDIENGNREITLSELNNYAKMFGLNISYFLNSKPFPKMEVLWRECSNEKKCRKIENFLIQYCQNFKHLNDIIEREYKPFKPPIHSELKKFNSDNYYNFATKLAEEYRRKWNLGEYPARNLIDAIKKDNILLFYHPFGDSGSAASIIGDFGAAILLNKNNVLWRLPFDVAHELYHLITWDYYDYSIDKSNLNIAKSNVEKHANLFAACLLMPKQTLITEINKVKVNNQVLENDIIEIACKFGVSLEALTYRLANLGIFTKEDMQEIRENEGFKKRFWDMIKNYTYFEGKITPLPEEYIKVAYHAYKSNKISKMKLAEYFNKKVGEIDNFLKKEYDFITQKGICIEHSPT